MEVKSLIGEHSYMIRFIIEANSSIHEKGDHKANEQR
jgi:hypothetical protein